MSNWDILWSSYDVFLNGFYNTLKLLSDQAIKGGGRGLVYETFDDAIKAFNAKGITP